MSISDTTLLKNWRGRRDADAFTELVRRHAAMVYGTCMRVARNRGMAEEIAQECFVELMQTRVEVRSPGGWLHTVATRRALDRVKAEGRRQVREAHYAATQAIATESTWDDTRAFVDEAIAALPEELRAPIIMRFLEGWAQTDIADDLGVSRKTVRLRIERGVENIRETLAKQGIVTSAVTLGVWLEEAAGEEVPPSLVAELGKRALATSPPAAAIPGGALTYLVASVAPVLLVVGGYAVLRDSDSPPPNDPVNVAPATAAAPGPSDTTSDQASAPTPIEATPVGDQELTPETQAILDPTADASKGWKLDLTPSEEVRETLANTKTKVKFEKKHVGEILAILQTAYRLNMVLDTRVVPPPPMIREVAPSDRYVTDGYVPLVHQIDEPLEKVLTATLMPLNLIHKVRGNTVWVSSSRQITEDLTVPPPSAPFRAGEILKDLARPVNMEFENIHISEILEFLSQSFGVEIRLDGRVVAPPAEANDSTPEGLEHFASDGVVAYICLRDVPLGEALFDVTRLLDLTYRVDRDTVRISTQNRLNYDF